MSDAAGITCEWRGRLDDVELEELHGSAFGHAPGNHGWGRQLTEHSLGWVIARHDGRLVGFINVAWDGAKHAFLLDTVVAADVRHHGLGAALVRTAVSGARAAGCSWVHVDFAAELEGFYIDRCGLQPTGGALLAL